MGIGIVVLGDIVGTPGRLAVRQCMETIRQRWAPDLVIANAENASNGSGLTPDLYTKLCAAGVDGITLGDHVYKKKQIIATLEREPNIIRPANLSTQAKGRTWMRLRVPRSTTDTPADSTDQTASVYVVTVLGRLFMNMPANDPFATVEHVLTQLPEPDPIVLVEIHAEATSEKIALGWCFNGRVAAVLGTHTHVPTADARILPPASNDAGPGLSRTALNQGGTAYITDLGMCGPHDSVLGRRIDRVVKTMSTGMPNPFDVASDNPMVQGVYLEINAQSRLATYITPIKLAADVTKPPFVSE